MKTRQGFVSNSSSSSFIAYGVAVSSEVDALEMMFDIVGEKQFERVLTDTVIERTYRVADLKERLQPLLPIQDRQGLAKLVDMLRNGDWLYDIMQELDAFRTGITFLALDSYNDDRVGVVGTIRAFEEYDLPNLENITTFVGDARIAKVDEQFSKLRQMGHAVIPALMIGTYPS